MAINGYIKPKWMMQVLSNPLTEIIDNNSLILFLFIKTNMATLPPLPQTWMSWSFQKTARKHRASKMNIGLVK